MSAFRHIPVMLDEVMQGLALGQDDLYVDGTYGGGGYAAAALAAGARVEGFDRDPRAVASAEPAVAASRGRLRLHCAAFSAMAELLGAGVAQGVACDLGFSSIQMDDASYGLSFQADGPLDMRLSGAGMTAAEFLNSADEAEIADILFHYGEEPASRRIARAIVAARPLSTTHQLAAAIRRAIRPKPDQKRDPATKSFQAIRIHVNDELGELTRGLEAAEAVLAPGGRLAVVSFHSLEDRIVKRFFAERSGTLPKGSRHAPATSDAGPAPSFEAPAKARRPGEAEVSANPRARSATLRVARRSAAPPWAASGVSAQAGQERFGHDAV